LTYRPVEADSGSIGGSFSHEFMVLAESGEDAIAFCDTCSYAANLEKAEIARPEKTAPKASDRPALESVETPDVRTIEEVSAFLNVSAKQIVKTLIFNADGKACAVLIRGDHEVNEIKVKNYLGAAELELADDDMIFKATGAPRGFAGPVGVKVRVIADYSILPLADMVTGANRENYHLKNVNLGRDFTVESFADLRVVRPGDACPRCGGEIKFARGIEVGHVFKLGAKYSKAMKAVYLDRDGKEKTMIMGCYGIGVGRTVAACIEQNFDQNGIIWPMPLAPYAAIVTPVNINEPEVMKAAEEIYAGLLAAEVEVILDDRDERAGVKFKDADLIGIPLRIVVGPKNLAQGKVELKIRKTGESRLYAKSDIVGEVRAIIAAELKQAG
ncbi:MAG: proline--tRNA ligase, partial [Smithellaceae bacterium]|nr:proline--tRNA ligase [Smithellaceae bacterium]